MCWEQAIIGGLGLGVGKPHILPHAQLLANWAYTYLFAGQLVGETNFRTYRRDRRLDPVVDGEADLVIAKAGELACGTTIPWFSVALDSPA